jgi:hypothetical protein
LVQSVDTFFRNFENTFEENASVSEEFDELGALHLVAVERLPIQTVVLEYLIEPVPEQFLQSLNHVKLTSWLGLLIN